MQSDAQQPPLGSTIDMDVQNRAGLEHAVDHPPHPPVGFLQHQDVIRADKRHGGRLAQPADEFANPQVGIG